MTSLPPSEMIVDRSNDWNNRRLIGVVVDKPWGQVAPFDTDSVDFAADHNLMAGAAAVSDCHWGSRAHEHGPQRGVGLDLLPDAGHQPHIANGRVAGLRDLPAAQLPPLPTQI